MTFCPYSTKLECNCFSAFRQLDLSDSASYGPFLNDDSLMRFYLTGEWRGREGITEYLDSYGGPLLSPLEGLTIPKLDFSESTEEECVAVISGVTRTYSKVPEDQNCLDFTGGSVLRFTIVGNGIPYSITNWDIWTTEEWFDALMSIMDRPSSREFACDGIINYCDGYSLDGNFSGPKRNQTTDECITELNALPSTENGYADGDSRGCRILHSTYVRDNSDHCPHVSFEKEVDVNGEFKCYKSNGLGAEDIFSDRQLEFMKRVTLPYSSENPFLAVHTESLCPQVDTGISPETFPQLFGLIVGAIAALFTLVVVYRELSIPSLRKSRSRERSQLGRKSLRTSEANFKKTFTPLSTPSSSNVEDHGTSDRQFVLSWKGLSCSYDSKKKSAGPIYALRNASGAIQAGELVAIMGPSGAGKTTLLDILSGRKSLGNVQGEMSVLGKRMTGNDILKEQAAATVRQVSAYVPQQEEFFPTQTPEEAVLFFASMRSGRNDVSADQIHAMLEIVGLKQDTWDRAIGGTQAAGVVIRGLSGGERKRLALACALALKPSILFLDEITSGLDSENSLLVTKVLKRACVHLNITAVVIVHQPGFRMFEMYDRLILLSNEATSLYSGKVGDINDFFKQQLQKKIPERHDLPSELLAEASKLENVETAPLSMELEETTALPSDSAENRFAVPRFFMFKSVLFRNLTNHYLRNLTNLAFRVVIYMLTAIVTGLIFFQIGAVLEEGDASNQEFPQQDVEALVGAGLFVALVAFLLPIAQMSTFFFDKKVYAADRALDLYPTWMYAASQFLLELWVLAIVTPIQTAIAVPIMSLWNPNLSMAESFFQLLSLFLASGLVGNAIVLFFAMISFSQDLALLMFAAFACNALATSGGFIPFDLMEPWVRWLQWVSPVKYSLQMYLMCIFNGTPALEASISFTGFDVPSTTSANLGASLAMYFFFSLMNVLVLSFQKEVR